MNYALIEYENEQQAYTAFENLKDLKLFDVPLKVKLSKHKTIDTQFEYSFNNNKIEQTIIDNSQNNNKYKMNTNLYNTRLSQSNVLFYNCPKGLTDLLLEELLIQIQKPIQIKKVKNKINGSRSFLANFESSNQAAEVIATMDDQAFNNVMIKCIFLK